MRKAAVIAAAICMLISGCGRIGSTEQVAVSGEFTVTIPDEGKADVIILTTENHTVVIDTGEKGDAKDIKQYLEESERESIDYLIITHFDKDHVGGAAKLIKNTEIGEVITPNYEGDNSEYTKYTEAAADKELTPLMLTESMSFTLDDVTFEIYPPMKAEYDETDNDYSLVVSARHGKNSFLFAGDCEAERLSELSEQMGDLKHTFLKVPHHGRYCAGAEDFIKNVSPKYSVITCDEENPADSRIVNILKRVGSKVYQTVDGDITVISDGKKLEAEQESE
jgi:beta-lactamase superfamily II metal-dependent hydrolase